MDNLNPLPSQLKWLAGGWLLLAILSLGPLITARDGQFGLNLGLLGFLFGPGLMLRRPAVRTALLVLTWLGFVFTGLLLLVALSTSQATWWVGLAVCIVAFIMLWAQYHVLAKPEARKAFDPYGRVE